jgi:peptidyl-prolyl cis-trans isomerase C
MTIRSPRTSAALAAAVLIAAGAAAQATRDLRPVAHVAGRTILAADLQDRLAAERKQAAMENRLDAFGPQATETALQSLIDVKLFAAQARTEGLPARQEVQHAIENAIDDVLAQALLAARGAQVPLDEAALRRYFDANPGEFRVPGRVRARHLVVRTQQEAESLLGRVRRSADFAALAKAHNIDTTRDSGGDLGWVSPGLMVEPVDRALFGLEPGEVSPVIRTSYGFHVVKVEEVEAGMTKPFASVAAEARQKILAAALDSWKAELRETHAVKIHHAVLGSLR